MECKICRQDIIEKGFIDRPIHNYTEDPRTNATLIYVCSKECARTFWLGIE